MPQAIKIPVTAITGFLGSGKTTLLNHILSHAEGKKIGVVVNDFGDINIDGKLVAQKSETMMELSNGCICCSANSLELDEAIAQFIYPTSPIEYIIIEASGLAEPYDLMQHLRSNLPSSVRLDSIVGVVDAHNIIANTEKNPTAALQIQYADFLIVNKIDLVTQVQKTQVKDLILMLNPRARIFETRYGQVDLDLILDQFKTESSVEFIPSSHDHSHHAHTHFTQVSYTSDKPFSPPAFQNFVNSQLPNTIYRAKGFVNLGKKGHDRKYIFQLVGSRAEILWDNWGDQKPITELVFIGRDIDEDGLVKKLNTCIDHKPNDYVPPSERVVLPKRAF